MFPLPGREATRTGERGGAVAAVAGLTQHAAEGTASSRTGALEQPGTGEALDVVVRCPQEAE
jgi:hypothetical protein